MEAACASAPNQKRIKAATSLLDSTFTTMSPDGRIMVVRTSSTIRAPADAIAAYVMDYSSFYNADVNKNDVNVTIDRVVEEVSDRHLIIHHGRTLPSPIANRDSVIRFVYSSPSSQEHFIALTDCEHPAAPLRPPSVRMRMTRAFRVTQTGASVSTLQVTSKLDFGGAIPTAITNSVTTPGFARAPLNILRYFMLIKDPDAYDEGGFDARAIGQLLVVDVSHVRTKRDRRMLERELAVVVDRANVLRAAQERFPWFESLLAEVLRNRVRAPTTAAGRTSLDKLGDKDARKLGGGFALQVRPRRATRPAQL